MEPQITFIALEGLDGVGKSTLANQLAKQATASGYEAIVIRHPGETDAGAAMREIVLNKDIDMHPLVQAQLILANRNQTLIELDKRIEGIDKPLFIITDRWDMSTLAYQSAFYNTYIESDHVKQVDFYNTLVNQIQQSILAVKNIISDPLHKAVSNPTYIHLKVTQDILDKRLETRTENERFENKDAAEFFNETNIGFTRAMGNSGHIPRALSFAYNVRDGMQTEDGEVLFDMVKEHDINYALRA